MTHIILNDKLKKLVLLVECPKDKRNCIETYFNAKVAGRVKGTSPLGQYTNKKHDEIIYLSDPSTSIINGSDIFNNNTSVIIYTSDMLLKSYLGTDALNRDCKVYELENITDDTITGCTLELQSKDGLSSELFDKLCKHNGITIKTKELEDEFEKEKQNEKEEIKTIEDYSSDSSDENEDEIVITDKVVRQHLLEHLIEINCCDDLVVNIQRISELAVNGCDYCKSLIEFLNSDQNKQDLLFSSTVESIIEKTKSTYNQKMIVEEQEEVTSTTQNVQITEILIEENQNNDENKKEEDVVRAIHAMGDLANYVSIKYRFDQVLTKNTRRGCFLVTVKGEIPKYDSYNYAADLIFTNETGLLVSEYLACVFEGATLNQHIIELMFKFRNIYLGNH